MSIEEKDEEEIFAFIAKLFETLQANANRSGLSKELIRERMGLALEQSEMSPELSLVIERAIYFDD